MPPLSSFWSIFSRAILVPLLNWRWFTQDGKHKERARKSFERQATTGENSHSYGRSPWSSNGDQHLASPYNTNVWLNIHVMRIKEKITKDGMDDFLNEWGEYTSWYCGFKGLTITPQKRILHQPLTDVTWFEAQFCDVSYLLKLCLTGSFTERVVFTLPDLARRIL